MQVPAGSTSTSASDSSTHATRSLNRQDYKTLALAALGGALEFYDFIVFVFLTAVIGQLFFPASMSDWMRQVQTFAIFAVGYLARPLGGIILAHFGDLLGRKKMFTLSIFLMAMPTLAIGLLPTYDAIGVAAPLALLLCRLLQGAAVGGEVAGAWVFVSEHVPARHTGYGCGTLTGGLTAGILLGSLAATAINTIYTPQEVLAWAWRLPFILGGAFGVGAMYLRRYLHETPVFIEMAQRKALAAEVPLKAVLRGHRKAVAMTAFLTWALSGAIVVVILMTPTLLQKLYGFDAKTALSASSVATLCLSAGCVAYGAMADRLGVKQVLFFGCLSLAVVCCLFYTSIRPHPELLLPLYAVTGFAVGVVGAIPQVLVNLFPPQVRFTGVSFSYNLAYAIFGGLTPIVITLMLKTMPLAPLLYVVAICSVGMATALSLRPRELA
ncbi:MAG: MFS transporter [Burkholderiaceae bacterium]|nr:MFS transporter [Burkholderiaceae bacterium]